MDFKKIKKMLMIVGIMFFSMSFFAYGESCGITSKCGCGDEVSSFAFLDEFNNVGACLEDGLILNVDNSFLDCRGENISSIVNVSEFSGIKILADNVTIKNCDVSNFYYGVEIFESNNVKLINNTLYNNFGAGVGVLNSNNVEITNNNISYNGWDGIFTENSSNIVIFDNKINHNVIDGIQLFTGTSRAVIKNNDIRFNDGHAIAPVSCDHDIDQSNIGGNGGTIGWFNFEENIVVEGLEYSEIIFCHVDNSEIKSVIMDNGDVKSDGILLVNSNNNRIVDSNLNNVRAGVYLYGSSNNVLENVVVKNSDFGIRIMQYSEGNTVLNSELFNNEIFLRVEDSNNNIFEEISLNLGIYSYIDYGDYLDIMEWDLDAKNISWMLYAKNYTWLVLSFGILILILLIISIKKLFFSKPKSLEY